MLEKIGGDFPALMTTVTWKDGFGRAVSDFTLWPPHPQEIIGNVGNGVNVVSINRQQKSSSEYVSACKFQLCDLMCTSAYLSWIKTRDEITVSTLHIVVFYWGFCCLFKMYGNVHFQFWQLNNDTRYTTYWKDTTNNRYGLVIICVKLHGVYLD